MEVKGRSANEWLAVCLGVFVAVALLVGIVVVYTFADRDDAPRWSLALVYLGVAAFAVHGVWRLVTTWNKPTRPPIDWWQRGPFEAVVVPGLAIAIGVGIAIDGGWGLVIGPLTFAAGAGAYAIELRWYRKPVVHPPSSSTIESMGHSRTLRDLYELHGQRDIEGALALFTDDVEWPDVAGGRVLRGTDAVRAYWTKQFAEIDPHVTAEAIDVEGGTAVVRVHQVVRSLDGTLLREGTVTHTYTFHSDKVSRMVVS